MTGYGMPRRHVATFGDLPDEPSPFLDVTVTEERERGRLAGAVTGRAVIEDDRGDVLGEGGGGGPLFSPAGDRTVKPNTKTTKRSGMRVRVTLLPR